jgi:hypothetical protein
VLQKENRDVDVNSTNRTTGIKRPIRVSTATTQLYALQLGLTGRSSAGEKGRFICQSRVQAVSTAVQKSVSVYKLGE